MAATFGCIGCGNMGAAILRGLSGRSDIELFGLDPDGEKVKTLSEEIGMTPVNTFREMAEQADYIMLAVKPYQLKQVLEELAPRLQASQTLISIAAGVTLKGLKTFCSGASPVIRVMPNTPAMVQSGVFALCFDDPSLKQEKCDFVEGVFSSLGQVHVLHEKDFDAFTALVGSGPAYVFYFMEALIEAGVTLGLQRPQATDMVKGLFVGASKLADESDFHVSLLREMVTSPGGTTIAATNVMDKQAVRSALVEAVKASAQRSKELGD